MSKKVLGELAENGLIGLNCEVVNSSQRSLVGVQGRIIDETLKTLTVATQQGEKKIQKDTVTLRVDFPTERAIIEGEDLLQRPQERLRKLWRKLR